MLTRRWFSSGMAGVAGCVLCEISTGFIATEASAQQAAPPPTAGVRRKVLSQVEGPTPGYVTIMVEGEIDPGALVARHTHPGIESGYILEGALELPVEGQPTRVLKAGDGFQVPANVPHAGARNGDKLTRFTSTYVVEKGKPLASPA